MTQRTKKILFTIGLVVIGIGVIAGLYYLIKNMVFGFVFLSIAAIVAMVIVRMFYSHHRNEKTDYASRRASRTTVLVIGALALVAMGCYFYPSSPKVYSNNDHHALAVEGFEIDRSQLLLAANSNDALFDNKNMAGSITLTNISTSDSTATLILNGVGLPIYRITHVPRTGLLSRLFKKNSLNYVALENQKNLHIFNSNEEVEFINQRGETAATLRIEYYKEKDSWKQLIKPLWGWHAHYILQYKENGGATETDTASYTGVIRKRYSMASIFPEIDSLNGIAFSKIELMRQRTAVNNAIKPKEAKDIPLIVGFEGSTGLSMVKSGERVTTIGRQTDLKVALDNTSYSIGLSSSIPDFRLGSDSIGMVIIRYRMPHYRYLTTEENDNPNEVFTYMVASTLIDERGNVNNQIAENILLYDEFDHPGNIHQMQPIYISFHRGSTRTPLEVKLLREDGSATKVKAGDVMSIATQSDGVKWILSLDNFKDPGLNRPIDVEPPFSAPMLLAVVAIFTLLCYLSLLFCSENRFSFIEPSVYIAVITLLAIRLTLLWRVSVFPPTNGIRLEEFNGWRTGQGIMPVLIKAFLILPVVVLCYKHTLNRFNIPSHKFLLYATIVLFPIILGLKVGYVIGIYAVAAFLIWAYYKWLYTNHKFINFINLYDFISDPSLDAIDERNSLWKLLFPMKDSRNIWLFVANIIIWIFIGIVGVILKEPTLCVGLPVIYYFLSDFIINALLGSRISDESNNSYAYIWHCLINSFFATGVLFVLDGGYGIVFLAFAMLTLVVKLFDIHGVHGNDGIQLPGVFCMAIAVVAGLICIKSIAIGIYTGSSFSVFLISTAIMTIVAVLIAWTMGGFRRETKGLLICIAVLSVAGGLLVASMPKIGGEHIFNRIMALDKDPASVLGKAESTSDINKFLNASLNDWVLEDYGERGKDMAAFIGKDGHDYFKIQPHSNVGVSWMTQVSDLSVSRFMIAEQSSALPVLLILLFFTLTVISLRAPADRQWARSLLIQIPLLLTIQSLLVWMAITRRFVFVGQDFPLISIISKVNTMMCFIGFLVWIVTAISERFYLMRKGDTISAGDRRAVRNEFWHSFAIGDRHNSIYKYQYVSSLWESGFLVFAMFLILLFGQATKHTKESHTYNVTECIDALHTLISDDKSNSVDELFLCYQESLIADYNRKNSHKIHDITHLGSPANILHSFCTAYNYQPGKHNSNSEIDRIFDSDQQYGPFAKTAFDHYLTHGAERNNINGLLYIAKYRYILEEMPEIENVRYEFDITRWHFRQKLPTRLDRAWRGSICAKSTLQDTTFGVFREGTVDVYTIPSSWTREHCIIVRPSNNSMSVVGRYEPRILRGHEGYCLTDGESLIGHNAPNLSKYGSGNYIARNVVINSQSGFIYPLQQDLFWAYPLSQQIGYYMNKQTNENPKSRYQSTYVSLSTSLTQDLHKRIERVAPNGNVAVVVADGNGHIRALIDHKKPRYRINPNDSRRIHQVADSLKQEGMLNRGREAERFFGNKAILWLNNGPGSSQKPIVWTAVTTQHNGWDWNKLTMAKINNNLMRSGSKYHAWSWAGRRFDPRGEVSDENRRMFRSIKGDEGGGKADVTVQSYMRNSSNYYNAIMVQIGTYTKEDLRNQPANNPLMTQRNAAWINYTKTNQRVLSYNDTIFPLIRYNGRVYSFTLPLNRKQILDSNSLIIIGLNENFNLPTENSKYLSNIIHPAMCGDHIVDHYAFPANSFFNNSARAQTADAAIAREAVKMTAIGKNSVWLVSPLVMAEMYGKMFSFNRNYSLTIDANRPKPQYEAFVTDGSAENYLKMRNLQFIAGLNEVFSEGGTASGVSKEIRSHQSRYYIYGKTGTIDGSEMVTLNGRRTKIKQEDHLLAVFITNKNLKTLSKPQDYSDLKFYVIYIADFNYNPDGFRWGDSDAAIINTILESEEFRNYMEGGKQ